MLDIVTNPIPDSIVNDSIDYVMLIFVLSAIAPENMPKVVEKIIKVLILLDFNILKHFLFVLI